jgi:hypothetical protein
MALTVNAIDVTDLPDLRRIAEEVRDTGRPCLLRIGDEEVAIVTPIGEATERRRRPTAEEEAASRASFGGWRGLVDGEQLKRDLAEARGSNRPTGES